MDEDKKWMLMTYYCPTHGDSSLVKPIQLTKKEISRTFLKKGKSSNNWFFKNNKDIVKKFFTLIQNFLIKDLCQTKSSRVFLISSIEKNFEKKFLNLVWF